MTPRKIALAPFLRSCPSVLTFGIRPAMGDYSEEERELMRQTEKIFFPSVRFVTVFQAIEKSTFPSPATYLYRRSRMHQQILFKYLGIPHGKTRIYFGRRQKERMVSEFRLPVDIMGPEALPGTVHHAADWPTAARYAAAINPAIVRGGSSLSRGCIRLTCVRFACIGAQRCTYEKGKFTILEPLALNDPSFSTLIIHSKEIARSAGLDDIAFDWELADGGWQLLQMARPPLRIETPGHTLCRHDYICELIEKGVL
jgi:hypothetical protein